MEVISSFRKLPMYNFGVRVVKDMDDTDRAYLEQNIQIALAQKEIDLEDAIAIRQLHDIDQAERLLVIRRKQRIKMQQEQQMQNIQAQSQANAQASQVASQSKMQEKQMEMQLEMQKIQFEAQVKAQILELEYRLKSELEAVKGSYDIQAANATVNASSGLEQMKEDRKDDRIEKQAVQQSKLISQRKGERPELAEETDIVDIILNK